MFNDSYNPPQFSANIENFPQQTQEDPKGTHLFGFIFLYLCKGCITTPFPLTSIFNCSLSLLRYCQHI